MARSIGPSSERTSCKDEKTVGNPRIKLKKSDPVIISLQFENLQCGKVSVCQCFFYKISFYHVRDRAGKLGS